MALKDTLDLMRSLTGGRVFVSMPKTPLTPKYFLENAWVRKASSKAGLERYHGILPLDECPLSPFDHGNLYGDGIFEGILIKHGRIYKLQDHLARLWRSAAALEINIPYAKTRLTKALIETAKRAGIKKSDAAYIRLVVTRGIGNLGIDPRKCAGPTVYAIISKIQLYPKEKYKTGIAMKVIRGVRRPGPSVLDPTVKSLNYLNNIRGLLEGVIHAQDSRVREGLMLTHRGYVAEATADNIFLVDKTGSKPVLLTPSDDYALEGITRASIIAFAKSLKIPVKVSSTILPQDLVGPKKEVFLTGTAAGVMPVVEIDGQQVGTGKPGPITKRLIAAHDADQRKKTSGVTIK